MGSSSGLCRGQADASAQSEEKYITCDYAREGRDLTVIYTWLGYDIVRSYPILLRLGWQWSLFAWSSL